MSERSSSELRPAPSDLVQVTEHLLIIIFNFLMFRFITLFWSFTTSAVYVKLRTDYIQVLSTIGVIVKLRSHYTDVVFIEHAF